MKRLSYIIGLFILLFAGCNEKWDDHYDENGNTIISSETVLEYLESQTEYTKFVAALKETGVAEELKRDQNLTVWAVDNDAMDQLAQMEEMFTDTFILQYHINNLSIGYSKLYDGLRMRSVNGKYIAVTMPSEDSVYVSDAMVIKTDQYCVNGVVHKIDHLMEPVISIYEYLKALGSDYSTIVDTIFNANDTVFDAENSAPIGVDITGNTIYDSIFVIQNPILDEIDFRSEFSQITMFLPNNDVIDDCLKNLNNQLNAIGAQESFDTIYAFEWIKGALFYEGVIKNIEPNADYISPMNFNPTKSITKDIVWRTSVQQLDPTPKPMSNGVIYDIVKMKIPNNVVIDRIKSLVHYYEYTDSISRLDLIEFINASNYYPRPRDSYDFTKYGGPKGIYKVLFIEGANPNDSLPAAVEFSPLKIETLPDNSTVASEMLIPAGEYKLYLGFRCKNHPFINVYFNGDLVAEELNVDPSNPWNYDRVTDTYPGISKYDGLGGLVNVVNVEGEGMQRIKIKIEFNRLGKGSTEAMEPFHWALVPTENNY